MSLQDILDTSFRLLRGHIRSVAIILGVVVAPVELISALATRNLGTGTGGFANVFTTSPSTGQDQTTTAVGFHLQWYAFLGIGLRWLILPFAAGAISRLVAGSYLGAEVGAGAALRAAGRRWLALLVATTVVHLLEVIGIFLVVLPGLLVMALSVAVAPAIVVDRLGPFRGIRRSWGLDRRRVWGIMGIALLTGLLFSFVASAISLPLTLVGHAIGEPFGWLFVFVGSVVASFFSVALSAIVATLIYFDGRIRNEGFDLEALAGRLGP